MKLAPYIPSSYFLYARLTPAVICSIPFFILYFFFLRFKLALFFETLAKIQWLQSISILTAFVFLTASVGRSISKDIFESRWFRSDETRMPTTELLLHSSSEYTAAFKTKIHRKILDDFGIVVLSADAELASEAMARKVIAEAVSLVRQKVKDGRLVLQHNMDYGFFRNLVGCSVIAVAVSALNIWVFWSVDFNQTALWVSFLTGVGYLLPITFSKVLMRRHGNRYARVLIQEYLSG